MLFPGELHQYKAEIGHVSWRSYNHGRVTSKPTSSARSGQWGDTTTGVIKTSCVGGGRQWGDMTTGIANRRLLLEGVLWGDNGTVERGSSVVECRTRNQVSPDSNPPLLPFRRLGIFVLSIESIWL